MNKYIIIFFATLSVFFGSNCFAHERPMILKPEAPNTIKGVKGAAKVGDYVLLRGRFVRELDANIYEFHDDENEALIVSFEGVVVPSDFTFNYEYFLWGIISQNDKLTKLDAKSLSPKRQMHHIGFKN